MSDVAIINIDMGNLFSIKCALDYVGLKSIITDDDKIIKNSRSVIIPGVGAFPEAMKRLREKKLDKTIYDCHEKKKSILGICLGMQILFTESHEITKTKGLNLIEGDVVKFSQKNYFNNTYTFNVGWNKIHTKKFEKNKSCVSECDNMEMYFIHSYHVIPKSENVCTSTSKFLKKEFVSSVKKDNIQGIQFHPEKSREHGIEIYNKFKNSL